MIDWHPIEDLPENWTVLQSSELAGLASIWNEQSAAFRNSEEVFRFNEMLKREWAIETGIIEGLYQIDRGTTILLIERGLDASLIPHGSTDKPAEEVVAILKDQHEALEWVFDYVANRRPLSVSYIKQLHSLLTRHQPTTQARDQFGNFVQVPLLRGEFKKNPNNPSRQDGLAHMYCPPEHVDAEMDRLIALHLEHQENGVPPELECAWLHHRFTQIHPFQDGNGRVARALASFILLRARWFPLVILRDQRTDYINALEKADAGELAPLVHVIVRSQKKAFVRALSLSENIRREADPIHQVIGSALERMRIKSAGPTGQREQLEQLANLLKQRASTRLREISDLLTRDLGEINRGFEAFVTESDAENQYYFTSDIFAIAKQLEYFADVRSFKSWVWMTIKEQRKTHIVISFHGLGSHAQGLLAASAFIKFRDRRPGDEEASSTEGPFPVCDEIFQFAHTENSDDVGNRFSDWLNHATLAALDQWRRQL